MLTPNLYATLVDAASNTPAKNIEENLVERFNALALGLAPELTQAFREVYTAGVRDGFVQGVAAASEEVRDR